MHIIGLALILATTDHVWLQLSSNQMHFAYTRNRHLGLSVNGSVRAPRDQVTHALHDF